MTKQKSYSYAAYGANFNPCIIMECNEIDITNGDPTLNDEFEETESTTEENEEQ